MGAVTVLRRPFLCGNCAGVFAVTACLVETDFGVSGGGSSVSSIFEGGSGAGAEADFGGRVGDLRQEIFCLSSSQT